MTAVGCSLRWRPMERVGRTVCESIGWYASVTMSMVPGAATGANSSSVAKVAGIPLGAEASNSHAVL